MAEDTLTKWYNTKVGDKSPSMTAMQIFQAGVSASAVSMRERAMKIAQASRIEVNDVVNGIGSLPDIP